MLGMALCAIPGVRQVAMHARMVGPLLDYIGMATFAAIGGATLPGRMTPGALGLEIGMGSEAGQRLIAWTGGR